MANLTLKEIQEKLKGLLNQGGKGKAKKLSSVTAFDITEDLHLVVLQASLKGGKPHINLYRKLKLDVSEQKLDAKGLGGAIAAVLKKEKIKVSHIVTGLGRSEVMLRQMFVPVAKDEGELAAMIHFQIAKDLPFRPEESVIDYSVLNTVESSGSQENNKDKKEQVTEKKLSVMVAVIPDMLRKRCEEIAAVIGHKLDGMGFNSDARYAYLKSRDVLVEKDDHATMVISLRQDVSVVDIFRKGHLVFSRESAVTRQSEDKNQFVEQVSRDAVRTLFTYEQSESYGLTRKIIIVGDKEEASLIKEVIAADLGSSEIEIVNICPSQMEGQTVENKDDEDNLTVLTGLACMALTHSAERYPIDFLNPKRPSLAPKHNYRQIALLAVTCLLVVVCFCAIRTSILRKHLDAKEVVQKQVNELQKDQNKFRQAILQARTLRSWKGGAKPWMDHLALLTSVLPNADEIVVSSFSTGARSNIVISVKAKESAILTKLDGTLRESGYALKTPAIIPVSGRTGYGYQTTFELLTGKNPNMTNVVLPPLRPEDDTLRVHQEQQKAKAEAESAKEPVQVAQTETEEATEEFVSVEEKEAVNYSPDPAAQAARRAEAAADAKKAKAIKAAFAQKVAQEPERRRGQGQGAFRQQQRPNDGNGNGNRNGNGSWNRNGNNGKGGNGNANVNGNGNRNGRGNGERPPRGQRPGNQQRRGA